MVEDEEEGKDEVKPEVEVSPQVRTAQISGGSYCHPHGNCAHNSADCHTPVPTHNNAATFADMGGNTQGCYWITS